MSFYNNDQINILQEAMNLACLELGIGLAESLKRERGPARREEFLGLAQRRGAIEVLRGSTFRNFAMATLIRPKPIDRLGNRLLDGGHGFRRRTRDVAFLTAAVTCATSQ